MQISGTHNKAKDTGEKFANSNSCSKLYISANLGESKSVKMVLLKDLTPYDNA